MDRKIIRKGHPEDNAFVERSHQTDDYEFYIPHLTNVKSEADFLKLGGWWIKVWNLYRPHMGLNNMTPYQKLRSLGYSIPKTFCLFPSLILDYLVDKKEILESPNTVQDHIDYDLNIDFFRYTRMRITKSGREACTKRNELTYTQNLRARLLQTIIKNVTDQ